MSDLPAFEVGKVYLTRDGRRATCTDHSLAGAAHFDVENASGSKSRWNRPGHPWHGRQWYGRQVGDKEHPTDIVAVYEEPARAPADAYANVKPGDAF